MPTLADIPDAFLTIGLLNPFVEWLIILPTTPENKTELLSIYARATNQTPTQAHYERIKTEGFLPHGR